MTMSLAEQLSTYLSHRLAGGAPVHVEGLSRIPGGASRETWLFDARWVDADMEVTHHLVVRKDPPASLLETEREVEYAFYSAFAGTDVPVPAMRCLENDPAHLGSPFFVMDRLLAVEAAPRLLQEPPYRDHHDAYARRMYEVLAEMHRFDWRGTPIEQWSPRTPAAEQCWSSELDHWESVLAANALGPQPVLAAAIRWLRRNPPPPPDRVGVVHGDYRVGNFLYRADGTIAAVVDWEMAHLGDPLEDLAFSLAELWQAARDGRPGGIVGMDEAIGLYEHFAGRSVDRSALHWWRVLNEVKLHTIWLTGARSFAEGRTDELMMVFCAWCLGNRQDESLLRLLGRLR